MTMKIHAFPSSPRGFKVLLAANHMGADYEFCLCDLATGVQKTPEFAAINPNMKMPALEDGSFKLWESNAILHYLAVTTPRAGLLGSDERAHADVLRWLFWESTTWDQAVATLVFERVVKPFFTGQPADPVVVEQGETKFKAAAEILNNHLKGRSYVCGEALSLADLALGSSLLMAERAEFPLQDFPEIQRWAAQVRALPAWTATEALLQPPVAA